MAEKEEIGDRDEGGAEDRDWRKNQRASDIALENPSTHSEERAAVPLSDHREQSTPLCILSFSF